MKFNFEIIKLPTISGRRTTFYTAYLPDEEINLFDEFLANAQITHLAELNHILTEIQAISDKTED